MKPRAANSKSLRSSAVTSAWASAREFRVFPLPILFSSLNNGSPQIADEIEIAFQHHVEASRAPAGFRIAHQRRGAFAIAAHDGSAFVAARKERQIFLIGLIGTRLF